MSLGSNIPCFLYFFIFVVVLILIRAVIGGIRHLDQAERPSEPKSLKDRLDPSASGTGEEWMCLKLRCRASNPGRAEFCRMCGQRRPHDPAHG